MIPFLSPFLARLLGERFKHLSDLIAIILLFGGVWAGLATWLHFHNSRVIAEYESGVTAEIIDATSEASAEADEAAAAYEAEFGMRQDKDRKDIENAKVNGSSPFDSWNEFGGVQPPKRADSEAARK